MRLSSLLLLSLIALAPACASRQEPQPASMPRPAYPPPPAYSQPQGYPPPQGHPPPRTYSPPAGYAYAASYSSPAYPTQISGPAPAPYAPQVSAVPLNVAALHALRTTPCAPEEVAPGVWISFDCSAPERVRRAVPFARRMAFSAGPLPPLIDHRLEGAEGPVKNQGAVGACTAFSLSSAMESAIRRTGRKDVLSALHIWSKYGVPSMGAAGDQNIEEPIALETSWPYSGAKACKLTRRPLDACGSAYGVASGTAALDPRLRAEQKMADVAGSYRLLVVEEINVSPPSIQEITSILASGDDLWVSFAVDRTAWKSRSMTNGVIPDYNSRGESGHAVVLAGYRPAGASRQFLIHNSWSERWGEKGYGWISEAMVLRHLRSAYRVRVSDGGGAAPPSPFPSPFPFPSPSPSPSRPVIPGLSIPGLSIPGLSIPRVLPIPSQPSSCANGQSKDLMTGQCVSACPGGAPAMGGVCVPAFRPVTM